MKILSAKMRAALVEPGASETTAEAAAAAAADLGELAGEVRIIRWMLASLLGVALAGFGLLGAAVIQILVRLLQRVARHQEGVHLPDLVAR